MPTSQPRTSENKARPESSSDHDIFQDPALAQTLVEDPAFRYIQDNWRGFLTIIIAIAMVYYGTTLFQQTRQQSLKAASAIYENLSREMTQYESLRQQIGELQEKSAEEEQNDSEKQVADLQKQQKESQERLRGFIAALKDTREPYTSLAALYEVLASEREVLSDVQYDPAEWNWKETEPGDSRRLYAELLTFREAQRLLDDQERSEKAKGILVDLINNSEYVHVASAVALLRSSSTDDEKIKAKALLESIREKHPEQEELIQQELSG